MIMTRRRIFHITCFAACCWKAGRQSGFLVSFKHKFQKKKKKKDVLYLFFDDDTNSFAAKMNV